MDDEEVLPFRLSRWDAALVGAAVAFFFSTFFPWQDFGCHLAKVAVQVCRSATAWQGTGAFAGFIAGLSAMALFILIIIHSAGLFGEMELSMPTLRIVLAGSAILLGLVRFLMAVIDHPGWGAWVGLVTLLALAAATFFKAQEDQAGEWRPPWM